VAPSLCIIIVTRCISTMYEMIIVVILNNNYNLILVECDVRLNRVFSEPFI